MNHFLCKTKIVATIGPSSRSKETIKNLILAGMDVARLNFSHGSHEEHLDNINKIRAANQELGTEIAIMLDTKGPEIRTHDFENGKVTLKKGNKVRIAMHEVLGTEEKFSVTHTDLINDVEVGNILLVDDGNLTLQVLSKDYDNQELVCLIENNATLKNRRGINVPSVKLSLPFLSEQDKKDLAFGCENEVDFVAASFVSCPEDIIEMRKFLREHGGKGIQIIAKIENTMGIRNFDEILSVADGIMVARGDLGVEVPIHEVPIFQRSIVSKCHFANKPVIVATQMLESMQYNPRPTRAEVNDVATAVLSGCDAIMLSGETASGLYPVESVTMMNTIALRMEEEINYKELMLRAQEARVNDIASTIALSVADAAHQLPVSAILTPTMSGFTARAVSHFRPKAPIIAVTMNRKVMRSLALSWGVFPILAVLQDNFENVIQQAIKEANKKFEFAPGDMVIVTAGIPLNIARTTNMMKIEIIK